MPQEGGPRRVPRCLPAGRSWRATGSSLVGQAVAPGRCPTTSHDHDQVQLDASAGPARPAPASSARLRRRQTTSRSRYRGAITPTPAVLAVWLPPHRRGRGTHRVRTQWTRNAWIPDVHTGHRTPDTGRPDAHTGHWTPVAWTSHGWTLSAHTGHWKPDAWMLAENADRATKARPASGHLGHHPSGRPLDAEACSRGRRLRRSAAQDGSAVRYLPARETPTAVPGSCSVAPSARPRLGALLSSDDYGSSVERDGGGHPLWQVHGGVDGCGRAREWITT